MGLRKLVLSCLLLLSFEASAAYTCHGLVKGLSIEAGTGDVLVERIGPLQWPRLCKVDGEHEGISAEACRTVYSTLMTAQVSQKSVTLWFNDNKDCSAASHAPWQWLTGWYFGPRLVD